MSMNAYHRGRAQGMLLYPRPSLNRPLADLLLTALHVEYGQPEGAAQCESFFQGYAEGQRTMEDAMTKKTASPAEPGQSTLVYINQLANLLADAQARIPRWTPAGEPKPDYGHNVIMSVEGYPMSFNGYIDRHGTWHFSDGRIVISRVLGWMEFPAPMVAEPAPAEAAHG